ncbi:Rieske (2Fe-2S) protein [Streptomyces sp. NPDC048483]|uniref:Rieske (2Fe-2S) protein n=1 Tax=Streptomyces sp. NPDC048483 TaxID=3154927 RepID=UPI003433D0F5
MARQESTERTASEGTAGPGRRAVVAAAGAVGLTAALAACGGGGASDGGGEAGAAAATGGDGGVLAQTSEIPKGGGKIFKAEKVVVTQPEDGEFKAFSAVCTHVGCIVGEVSGGTINCMCHGSKFDLTDGSVKDGPATGPLAPAKVKVEGGSVTLG